MIQSRKGKHKTEPIIAPGNLPPKMERQVGRVQDAIQGESEQAYAILCFLCFHS